MSEYAFQFAVLRYTHDPVTQEFLNVGVVVYSREARYVKASISSRYSRLSDTFQGINGEHYRRVTSYIERRIAEMHRQVAPPQLFDDLPSQIEMILAQVLPADDSSLAFGGYGGGLTNDLDAELARLYGRLVERYIEAEEYPSRTDKEVWHVYRQEFDKYDIPLHLRPVKIHTPTYHYEFDYAWKNERWHPIEAISLDLMRERSILDKANQWIGRTTMLSDSDQIGTLYMLLGAPRQQDLKQAYEKAVHNMGAKIPLHTRFVEEKDARAFSGELAKMINGHEPPD